MSKGVHAVRAKTPLLTLEAVARRHDVDARTIRRWVRAGCPIARRGKPGQRAPMFEASNVDKWVSAKAASEDGLVVALTSKLDAQARRAKRQRDQLERGHVVPRDVVDAWRMFVAEITATCETAVPSIVAEVIRVAPIGVHAVGQALHAAIYRLLRELAGDRGGEPAGSAPNLHPRTKRRHDATPAADRIVSSTTIRDARAQLAQLEAKVLMLKEAIATGELRPLVDVEAAWYGRVTAARAKLLGAEQTAADRLHRAATLGDAAAVEREVRAAFAEALDELVDRADTTTVPREEAAA